MRFYNINDVELPSVTSIIGEIYAKPELANWKARMGEAKANKISREAASFGTACHNLIEKYLNPKEEVALLFGKDVSEKTTSAIERWHEWWKHQQLTPIRTEMTVWTDTYAGTLDLLARDKKGRAVVVDWKFGKGLYESYLIQIGAYYAALKLNILRKKENVRFRGMIVRVGPSDNKRPEVKKLDEKKLIEHAEAFEHLMSLWRWKSHYGKISSNAKRIRTFT